MLNLLSGISPEIRVIMLFGFIGLILLAAGTVLIVGLRRQAIENSGRFDIPLRSKNPNRPAKVKKAKPEKVKKVKEPKPAKVKAQKPAPAPKPEKVKKTKADKQEKPKKEAPVKPEKSKKPGFFKKAAKPTGIALLAAPVGSNVAPEKVANTIAEAPVVPVVPVAPVAAPALSSLESDDFDILPPVKQPSLAAPAADDDFDFATYDAPTPQQPNAPGATGGPFGSPAPAGDEEW